MSIAVTIGAVKNNTKVKNGSTPRAGQNQAKKFMAAQLEIKALSAAAANKETGLTQKVKRAKTGGRKKGDFVTISLWLSNTTIAMLRGLMSTHEATQDGVISAALILLVNQGIDPEISKYLNKPALKTKGYL
jgi:hypothetical protein